MDPEKLKSLQIKPEAKRRSQRSLGMILLIIGLITAAAIYQAWPRKEDDRRLSAKSSGSLSPQ